MCVGDSLWRATLGGRMPGPGGEVGGAGVCLVLLLAPLPFPLGAVLSFSAEVGSENRVGGTEGDVEGELEERPKEMVCGAEEGS